MRFILNWLCSAIAVAVAAAIVPGITAFGPVDPWLAFIFTGLFLGFVNALVKPIITIVSLPATILTLGVFQLVVNSFMLVLAGWLSVTIFGAGIVIAGFWSAFAGAIIVSIVGSITGLVIK